MKFAFLIRQLANAVLTATSHMDEDRVFFTMQLARRLPNAASRSIAALLNWMPGVAPSAASAWLLGQEARAKDFIITEEVEHPNRLLGEIALNMGMLDVATRIAESIGSGASLRSRILWTLGHIDEAIDALPDTRRADRLRAEREILSPGWWPKVEERVVARRPDGARPIEGPSSLHVLTNSLPHTQSGYAYRSHLILKTLQDSGHSVVAATRPSYPVTIGRLSSGEVETVEGIDYLRQVPIVPSLTPGTRLNEQAAWIASQAHRYGVDVLHTTTHYVNGLATGAAARATHLPWVYEVRGVLEETWAAAGGTDAERIARRNSQRFSLMRRKEIEVATNADAVITLGETMRDHLVANGVSENSITLIPNSVSEAVVNADTSRAPAEVRAGLGLPGAGIWVGTAASIVGYEGLDDLVDAVVIARAKGTDLRLLIAGDGVALPELRERAAVLGENAIFTGRVSQTEAIEYQLGLDAIVVPRKNEPVCRLVTPIKPIEAMGLARPVVISDLPALRELVPESAGLRVDSGNPARLAELLAELAHDDGAREMFGENGRAHVLGTRRWKDIGRRYGQVYTQLLGWCAK
ncbi:MAG: glycosyltransferase family 4 protein [Brevibacterium aurantiacum]|uniref:glycosyltransferase family 4 protein n=1 Tax=Brevibacterium aurantiacum TaxID=273384 RepID=UPI003F90D31F